MKRMKLDRRGGPIKEFVRSLPLRQDGLVLELDGEPILCVFPPTRDPVDPRKLKDAILRRKSESRRLNADWADADLDAWGIPRR